ncbi:undecaprenyldiphospho-muramoylpentapeptide beta-N-acetylglucosaminyltransferase [Paenibacillus sp. GCM10023252]|uniref:undecaprenyldiphospho-muramoylpentapeptide beta-N-acetylglucosaminyltransferase n=1 Tax=Paenibacillus sp. GCM10023252 TaxID=3252649 RepID=UPI0036096A9A
MRIVLTGGGTGGHIYPAAAVGKQLQEENPETELLYIGTSKGLESRIVPALGIPFEAIEITGFRRKLSFDNVKTVARFIRGVARSKELLRKFKPDAVVGTGGYVCGPVVYAAAKLGIPTLIHEQNAIPGLTNKFLARYVDSVAVSFKESEPYFAKAKHTFYAGNPCATHVLRAEASRGLASLGLPRDSRMVLMVGGSRGAKAFNDVLVDMAPHLQRLAGVHFVFVTGEHYYESTMDRLRSVQPALSNHIHILPYLNNMPEVLAASQLVISRSGASSLAEMTALGLPSLLIPSPNVTNNHQEANARSLVEAGASEMLLERELSGQALLDRMTAIIGDAKRLKAMSEAAAKLGVPDSASRITARLKQLSSSR